MAVHQLVFDDNDLRRLLDHYESDRFFGPVVAALRGECPNKQNQRRRLKRLLPRYRREGWKLFFGDQFCVSRCAVRSLLELVHDSKTGATSGRQRLWNV